ncbi:MAG: hypothetical protein U9Q17_03395, partial [Chloroflexota bacterium]|nr:hypothetical protein [Chloroflexota bacterium]
MNSVIKHISHPYASELWQARMDQAHITGQPLVEKPWWYQDMETGFLFHDIYACLGWPSEVSDKDTGLPGYAAIVGIVRPHDLDRDTHYIPQDADFLLLAEAEHKDVPTLLAKCVEMREKYGYGVQPELLKVWFGDPDRFYTALALFNERLGEQKAILVTPADDFYTSKKIFDNYVRSFQSTVMAGKQRFFYGENDILKSRLKEFYRDDPAALAIGGLVHSLLGRCMWMSQTEQGA